MVAVGGGGGGGGGAEPPDEPPQADSDSVTMAVAKIRLIPFITVSLQSVRLPAAVTIL